MLKSISLPGVRAMLEKVFALVGTPDVLCCENIDPLRSRGVQQYLRLMGVGALRISPEKGTQEMERVCFMSQLPGPSVKGPGRRRHGVVPTQVSRTIPLDTPLCYGTGP